MHSSLGIITFISVSALLTYLMLKSEPRDMTEVLLEHHARKSSPQTIMEDRHHLDEVLPNATIQEEVAYLKSLGYTENQIKGKW